MRTTRLRVYAYVAAAIVAALGTGFGASSAHAQTINGTLMEVESDRPISLGLIILMTEQGDSITSAVTDSNGRFRVESDDPGAFVLIASAFGFKETRVGVFELGSGGSMDIEFRVGAEAMPIDGILVELQRPALQHQLVTNGFVRRLQRGTGMFITPYDIEQSSALRTGDLFRGLPGVAVQTVGDNSSTFLGETVRFLSATGYCTPTMYLDGVRLSPAVVSSMAIENLIPIAEIDAAEIYRRAAEVPIEYGATGVSAPDEYGVCGVIVLWTRRR